MLTIRLSRTGKRHAPQYRIVVQEKHRDPWAPALEIVGNYNPRKNPSIIDLKEDRIKEWISKGAQPSETVLNLLVDAGIVKADKARSVSITKKRATALEEKKAEELAKKKEKEEAEAAAKAEAEAKAAEEKAAAEAAAKTAEETKVEETTEETPAEEKTEESKEEAAE